MITQSKCQRSLLWFLVFHGGATATRGDPSGGRQLSQTPTWAVAIVCTFLILISHLLEKGLQRLANWLWKKHKNSLLEALEKIKAELMILGFISLLLTFGETYILKICVSRKAALSMLPCSSEDIELFQNLAPFLSTRLSAAGDTSVNCKQGSDPLITLKGLHQLHILLFFLAISHILYSLITMMLSRLKIRGWKKWEQETLSHDYEFSTDHSRLRLTHETSFVREHISFWTTIPFFFYVGCFLRQFFVSVGRTDYLTLRHGFISAHLAPGRKFNFQRYIKRSLEDDFKLVVGISPVLWASFVIFLLFNVNGWRTLFWASIPPVLIILAVGTKLQAIMATMALEIVETHEVVQGMPLVQGSDRYFWFDCPQLLLHLIHFALFQNAFQITHFFWIWYSFGLKSCFHKDFNLVIIKLFLCLGALILCSYSTLPLYALVTQMGSHMKKAVFDEQMAKALKKWHKDTKLKKGKARKLPSKTLGVSESFSISSSSFATTLHRSKTTGHSSNIKYYKQEDEEDEMSSDLETAGAEDAIDRIQQRQMQLHHS
ncbi:PREDICTED: MLO-like protein 7 [Camelina sativa]|uniref:MLO-like protein n=1 Tax=Camelina sativa TaxID=90675 RepID=A0ABM0XQF9_CAMSA|nr:PREDICTED: MLO-like protein 7 [Camelina sativa]